MENDKPSVGVAIPEIKTAADFWRHVQSPSNRIKDANIQRTLALDAARHFKDPLVRLAAVTVYNYRAVEKGLLSEPLHQELLAITNGVVSEYPEKPSFQQLRWLISVNVSICCVDIARGDMCPAFDRAIANTKWTAHAHSLGQVFTNVVKSCLLAIALVNKLDEPRESAYAICCARAEAILEHSSRVAENYSFASQFAYEELSSVYNMLFQIFRWVQFYKGSVKAGISPALSPELAAFEPKALGGFLYKLLKGEIPPK